MLQPCRESNGETTDPVRCPFNYYICKEMNPKASNQRAFQQLGAFEELILLAIGGLGGVSIQQQIRAKTGRPATLGAIYSAVSRLHTKGCVVSAWGKVTHQRGGKRKRLYTIISVGRDALYYDSPST